MTSKINGYVCENLTMRKCSVYEKLFETSDIMSDVLELFVVSRILELATQTSTNKKDSYLDNVQKPLGFLVVQGDLASELIVMSSRVLGRGGYQSELGSCLVILLTHHINALLELGQLHLFCPHL